MISPWQPLLYNILSNCIISKVKISETCGDDIEVELKRNEK